MRHRAVTPRFGTFKEVALLSEDMKLTTLGGVTVVVGGTALSMEIFYRQKTS